MKILIVAASSFAGMGHYVCEIVNNLRPANVSIFLVDDENGFFRKNISNENLNRYVIVKQANTKWNKLHMLFRTPARIVNAFKQLCIQEEFDIVHFISDESLYGNMVRWAQKHYTVLLTVHDATVHDMQKELHKLIRQKILYHKYFEIINDMRNLVTNSHCQFQRLTAQYPLKNIFYHSFPGLVTDTIAKGGIEVPELKGINDYILFFGRIEKYKGVDLLYNAFIGSQYLNARYKLVIAGSGDIYFRCQTEYAGRIIFVNRYIKDEEVASLYRNAACVVYPYTSATQSGVLSLSCYFRKRTVASDIDFFREQIQDRHIANLFTNNDISDLQRVLLLTLSDDNSEMEEAQASFYRTEYEKGVVYQQLMDIYNRIQ